MKKKMKMKMKKPKIAILDGDIIAWKVAFVADIEGESVLVFRQLNDFANESSEHEWFVEWSRKLVELVRERKLSQE